MAVALDVIEYENEGAVLPQKPVIPLDAPRYVALLGDFITDYAKLQLKSIGSRSGGLRVGHSDTEGCPTMWRTHYMIRRAAFTPLEMTSIQPKADEKDKDHHQLMERIIYPAADMITLTDDAFREQGVVELTALRNSPWAEGLAKELNVHFFPDFNVWRAGDKPFPTLLADYVELVTNARIDTEVHLTTQAELLESARAFKVFAKAQIEFNRQRIQSTRNQDMGGFSIGWSSRSRLFAEQLSIPLENENDIAPAPQEKADPQVVAEAKRANDLKERELAYKERELAILEGKSPVVEEVAAAECGHPTASGACTRVLKAGEIACWQHLKKPVEEPQVDG